MAAAGRRTAPRPAHRLRSPFPVSCVEVGISHHPGSGLPASVVALSTAGCRRDLSTDQRVATDFDQLPQDPGPSRIRKGARAARAGPRLSNPSAASSVADLGGPRRWHPLHRWCRLGRQHRRALAALLAQMLTGAPPSEPEMPGPQLRAPSSASADGSRNVPPNPDRGDRRRRLIPAGGYARVLTRPGPQTRARSRVSRIDARDFTGAARLPEARP